MAGKRRKWRKTNPLVVSDENCQTTEYRFEINTKMNIKLRGFSLRIDFGLRCKIKTGLEISKFIHPTHKKNSAQMGSKTLAKDNKKMINIYYIHKYIFSFDHENKDIYINLLPLKN